MWPNRADRREVGAPAQRPSNLRREQAVDNAALARRVQAQFGGVPQEVEWAIENGRLSHASLVAREYGIAAVVGTGDANRRLRTGQVVTVDGAAGTVAI